MKPRKIAILVAFILSCGGAVAQKSSSAASAESPERFMRRVLEMANGGDRDLAILDMGERVYTPSFLDAMFGKGCFTSHRLCDIDHLVWAKICGCRYFPGDVGKKHDPLCGCPAKLKFSRLSVAQANSDSAEVSALLNLEPHGNSKVSWHLVMTPKGWRVDNVTTRDFPSLRAMMSR